MCGYAKKALATETTAAPRYILPAYSESADTLPKRVQLEVHRLVHTVLKRLFTRLADGDVLQKEMTCHSKAFLYLVEHDDDSLRMVMLYRQNSDNIDASILSHSVVCTGNHIVYDSRRSNVTDIVHDTYHDSTTGLTLTVGVRLSFAAIQTLIGDQTSESTSSVLSTT
jgi:hypothetical protein